MEPMTAIIAAALLLTACWIIYKSLPDDIPDDAPDDWWGI
jgi:hypothetical protein